jgi:hypothetical protein
MKLGKKLFFAALAIVIGVSAAQAQTTLRYQFKEGDKLPYVMEQKMKMTMSIMGVEIDTTMNMDMQMSLNVLEKAKDGGHVVQFKVAGAKMVMDGPTGKVTVDSTDKNEPDDPVGKILYGLVKAIGTMEMKGTMLPTGETKDVKLSEETAKALANVPGADKLGDAANGDALKSMLASIVFPNEAIMKGKTWTNKTDTKTQIGKTTTENTYTYEGADQNGLEKIGVKPSIKIDADPNADVKIKLKNAKGTGQILFDNKNGRLVESTTTQTMQMQLNAMGIDLDQTIQQTTTLRLKK